MTDAELTCFERLSPREQRDVMQLLHWLDLSDRKRYQILAALCSHQALHHSSLTILFEVVERQLLRTTSSENTRSGALRDNGDTRHDAVQNVTNFISFVLSVSLGSQREYSEKLYCRKSTNFHSGG